MSREITIFTSASRAGNQTSPTITNTTEIGADIAIDMTVGSFITVIVEGQDPASGKWYEIARNASSNQVETRTIRIHPALTPASGDDDNLYFSAALPLTWRVRVETAGTPTYSVGAFVY